jgi:hypothetical protein
MAYLDEDALPLTAVVGGKVDLLRLISELETMYPDRFPDCNISERELAFQAGAIAVIKYLKSKTKRE